MEDQENFILEDADINKNVVTLRELAERRKVLLQKKREILNRLNYQNQPVIQPVSTPLSENQNLPPEIPMSDNENVPLSENFTSEFTTLTTILDPPDTMQSEYLSTPIDSNDVAENLMTSDVDFMCDHSFVNLSDITNLKPLSPDSVEWFPEREMEENKKNRKRRKGDQNNWKRMKNKRQRMMGKEYIGFKKEGTKFVQNDPKPARVHYVCQQDASVVKLCTVQN